MDYFRCNIVMNTDYYLYVVKLCIILVTTMCNFIPKETLARNCNHFRKHECSIFLLTNNLMYITITLIGRTVPASHDSFYAYIHSTFYHNFA